jgi:hypothetical protein
MLIPRHQPTRQLIKEVYQAESFVEGMKELLQDKCVSAELVAAGCTIGPTMKRPSVSELLALKDRLGISGTFVLVVMCGSSTLVVRVRKITYYQLHAGSPPHCD